MLYKIDGNDMGYKIGMKRQTDFADELGFSVGNEHKITLSSFIPAELEYQCADVVELGLKRCALSTA